MKTHAREYWRFDSEQVELIKPHKIDIAIDMKGGFLAEHFNEAYDTVQGLATKWIRKIFQSTNSNFIPVFDVEGLETKSGDNNLDSCFQYRVNDQNGNKLLNIKAYDKVLDLVGREASFLVSSRLSKML